MNKKVIEFNKKLRANEKMDFRSGDIVKIHLKIKEGDKERLQAFEGIVLARKHGNEMGATITVRKEVVGVGVERIFPIHSPVIDKIEILKKGKEEIFQKPKMILLQLEIPNP